MNETEMTRVARLLALYALLALSTAVGGCGGGGVTPPPPDAGAAACDGGDGLPCYPMAHNITGTGVYSGTIPIPDDGDKVTATRANPGDGPVNPALTTLVNDAVYAHSAVLGVAQLPTLSSTDGVTVAYGALPAVTFNAGVLTLSAGSFNAAAVLGTPLANSTWYYAYLTSGGTLAVSTTGPDPTLHYMSGDFTKAYLGCFVTDSSAIIVPFYAVNGAHVYSVPPTAVIVGSAVPSAPTDIALTAVIPPHARSVTMNLLGAPNGATNDTGYVRVKGITATGYTTAPTLQTAVNPNTANTEVQFDIHTDASQKIQYWYNVGGGSSFLSLTCAGFRE